MTQTEKIEALLKKLKQRPDAQAMIRETRRSFAYGNTKIENDRITREMINQADHELFGSE